MSHVLIKVFLVPSKVLIIFIIKLWQLHVCVHCTWIPGIDSVYICIYLLLIILLPTCQRRYA